ncbi:SDR family NAD(P)-dependent oxidoreductase [Chitinophaga rhizosphaerae]|uniref:SDR family NAD(P)-dependent oxidoreductase n=1 Tax=Chitinophaga rhizosphaerae TaxID=1864947 RepID=UPI001F0BB099|nr:SDR family oxidoreductase [Chitinophaga rhizosphaerae]
MPGLIMERMKDMLKDKVVLLTGGADGIGWECALAYAAAGARVCIADLNAAGQDKLPKLPGEGHTFHQCDVTSGPAVVQLFAGIGKVYGRLDAVHNNAGIAQPARPLHDTEDAEWEALMRVNLKSIYLTTRHGIALLRASKGCILHTSSLVGSIGQENHAAYVATKGAVNALTKAMALDYAADGIRVNAVAPAAIRTPMLEAWSAEQPQPEIMQRYLDRLQPLGAMPAGDVIADACVFLLSDAARFITGCILPVSGGAELGYRAMI